MKKVADCGLQIAALLWFCGVGYAAELPLPPDVSKAHLGDPFEMVIGSQPTRAQMYATRMSVEGVRAFYEQSLPKHGWQVEPLPWVAHVQQNRKTFEQAMRQHPEIAGDPALTQQLQQIREGFGARQPNTARALYATQGQERALVMFDPMEQQTMVMVQRWEQTSASPGGPFDAVDATKETGQAGWPTENPCCTGAQVPEPLRKVPTTVPRYPNGRMIVATSGPGGQPTEATETYLSKDSVEAVMDFYRQHMAYNGWTLLDTPETSTNAMRPYLGPQAEQFDMQILSFRNEQAICGVVATASLGGMGAEASAGLTPAQRAALPAEVSATMPNPDERTLITVNYMELDPALLKRLGATR